MNEYVPPRIDLIVSTINVDDEKMTSEGHHISALIDTGAALSALPKSFIDMIQAFATSLVEVNFLAGRTKLLKYMLKIGFKLPNGTLLTTTSEFAGIEGLNDPIIGADVLTALGLKVTLDYKNNAVHINSMNWANFEDEVSALYRALGAKVKQNVNLAGFQIDIYIEEVTSSKQKLRLACECKFYKTPIGNRIVNDFSRVVDTLKSVGLVDKGVIVSAAGFTADASLVAEKTGIELLKYDDLLQSASEKQGRTSVAGFSEPQTPEEYVKDAEEDISLRTANVFVIMPFAPDFDDLYHLGIREVVSKLGLTCERADEIEYAGEVMNKIHDSINKARLVIAEVSTQNPNVSYEVGYAHALKIPVVLLTKNIEMAPFDIRGYNHIVYKSIVELRDKLEKRLKSILGDTIKRK